MATNLVAEVIGTFIPVFFGCGAAVLAGGDIGLTLAAIHLVGIKVTGVSVNPARSIGPAVVVGGEAIRELWVFIAAPLAGGLVAGVPHAAGITRAD